VTVRPAATPAPLPASSVSLSTLWWIGFALVAVRFLTGALRTGWIVRRARPAGTADGARIVESPQAPMAMTWGIFRPVVILPAEAATWDAERRRVVLLHELTHVRRRDLLAQAIAQAACCLYWFHPLAWTALRELRKERERACDDGVLATGIAPHEYASHVMDLARSLADRRASLADAPAMADTSDLESRIRAMLDRGRTRRPLQRRAVLAVTTVALAVLVPLSSVSLLAQVGLGTVTGVVKDPSGGRVPASFVTATNLDTGNEVTTTADMTGEYRFAAIPSGRYTIAFEARGFKKLRRNITLVGGAVDEVDGALQVGNIAETIRVVAGPSAGAAPGAVAVALRTADSIRIGGNVQQARLVRQPRPVYPAELKDSKIGGVVKLSAVIGKDGTLHSVEVIASPDYRLANAAMDAVKQWRYEPTRLNGEPIEVVTQIDVDFYLGQ
jgi:TonB family protein